MKKQKGLYVGLLAALLFGIAVERVVGQAIERLPLDLLPQLSGNFGELRPNHFHSGIDFKTAGVVGKPVYAVDGGYVSRITVSPSGYGKVIYLSHPSGLTTVYGHLDGFAQPFDSLVESYQYELEEFAVNLTFQSGELPVAKGQLIAYSGNSGSSAGPHLHFETRKTAGNVAVNPLVHIPLKLKDGRKPVIGGVMFHPLDSMSSVNKRRDTWVASTNQSGRLSGTKRLEGWGRLATGIRAIDHMDNSSNRFGVERVRLFVDDSLRFETLVDHIPLEDARSFNSHIFYSEWKESGLFYIRLHKQSRNRFNLYPTVVDDGAIEIAEERAYRLRYEVSDYAGNMARLDLTIHGKRSEGAADSVQATDYMSLDETSIGRFTEVTYTIPGTALYDRIYTKYEKRPSSSFYSSIHSIGSNRYPLHLPGDIQIKLLNDTLKNKAHYYIGVLSKGRVRWLGGRYINGTITTRMPEFGEYVVSADTVSPVITPISDRSYRISDSQTGIKRFKGTLDGAFVLMEYDAKRSRLDLIPSEKRFGKPQERDFKLIVEDNCGNVEIYQRKVVI